MAISGTGRGQRRRSARTLSNAQRARISASAAGASGTAATISGGRLGGGGDRIPCPGGLRQAFRQRFRGSDRKVEEAAAAGKPAGVETGRPGGELAPQLQAALRLAETGVADGEAQVAQSRRIGVEAEDLGGGRGALKRQAGAERAGGGRVAAQMRVEEREAGRRRRTADRSPLPFRSPAPRPEPPPAAEKLAFRGSFGAVRSLPRALAASGAATASPRSTRGSGTRVELGANHLAMMNSVAALCHVFSERIRPACRGVGMSDKIALSDTIRKALGRNGKGREIRPWGRLDGS